MSFDVTMQESYPGEVLLGRASHCGGFGYVSSSPFMEVWVGTAISAVGVILAVTFYFKSRKRPRPLYRVLTYPVVGPRGLKDVEIRYRGETVPRVSSAAVLFWNAGTATLDGSDVAEADPLRIEIPEDGRILNAQVVARTREANQGDIAVGGESTTSIPIIFDFLDPGDGLTALVLHTGTPRAVKVLGTVKGVPKGPQSLGESIALGRGVPKRETDWTQTGVLTAAGGVGTLIAFSGDAGEASWIMRGLSLFVGASALIGAAFSFRSNWRKRFRTPRDLDPE